MSGLPPDGRKSALHERSLVPHLSDLTPDIAKSAYSHQDSDDADSSEDDTDPKRGMVVYVLGGKMTLTLFGSSVDLFIWLPFWISELPVVFIGAGKVAWAGFWLCVAPGVAEC